MEGRIIARKFELMRLIGRGAMGVVYEARHLEVPKRCAIKLMEAAGPDLDPERVRRFVREARAASSIESDHVVDVYDFGWDEESRAPYLVMELLDGDDLERTRQRLAPLEPTVACKLVLQAAIGLAQAHAAGVIHRDVKPPNLFLARASCSQVRVKILDFGIAKLRREIGDASTPFGVRSLGPLIASILGEPLPALQDQAPWVVPEIACIVHRALSRDLRQRFPDASAMRDALAFVVPAGTELLESELCTVAESSRAQRAARWDPARSSSQLTVTRDFAPAHSARLRNLAAMSALTAAALSGAGVLMWNFSLPRRALQPSTNALQARVNVPLPTSTPSLPLAVAPEQPAIESSAQLPALHGSVAAPPTAPARAAKKRAAPLGSAPGSVAASALPAPEKTSLGELVIDETEFGAAARGKR
jgi:tRNA A-37 threonylcarbamoyl transferase component Bud32